MERRMKILLTQVVPMLAIAYYGAACAPINQSSANTPPIPPNHAGLTGDTLYTRSSVTSFKADNLDGASKVDIAISPVGPKANFSNFFGKPLGDSVTVTDLQPNTTYTANVDAQTCTMDWFTQKCNDIQKLVHIIYDTIPPTATVQSIKSEGGKLVLQVQYADNLAGVPENTKTIVIDQPNLGTNEVYTGTCDNAGNCDTTQTEATYDPFTSGISITQTKFNTSNQEVTINGRFQDPSGNLNRSPSADGSQENYPLWSQAFDCDPSVNSGNQFSIICHTPQKSGRVKVDFVTTDVNGIKSTQQIEVESPDIPLEKQLLFYTLLSLMSTMAIGGPTYLGIREIKKRTNQTIQVMNDQLAHLEVERAEILNQGLPSKARREGEKKIGVVKKMKTDFNGSLNMADAPKIAMEFPKWFSETSKIDIKPAANRIWVKYIQYLSEHAQIMDPAAIKASFRELWNQLINHKVIPPLIMRVTEPEIFDVLISSYFAHNNTVETFSQVFDQSPTAQHVIQNWREVLSKGDRFGAEEIHRFGSLTKALQILLKFTAQQDMKAIHGIIENKIISIAEIISLYREVGRYDIVEQLAEKYLDKSRLESLLEEVQSDTTVTGIRHDIEETFVPDFAQFAPLRQRILFSHLPKKTVDILLYELHQYEEIASMFKEGHLENFHKQNTLIRRHVLLYLSRQNDFVLLNRLQEEAQASPDAIEFALATNERLAEITKEFYVHFNVLSENNIREAETQVLNGYEVLPTVFTDRIRELSGRYRNILRSINANNITDLESAPQNAREWYMHELIVRRRFDLYDRLITAYAIGFSSDQSFLSNHFRQEFEKFRALLQFEQRSLDEAGQYIASAQVPQLVKDRMEFELKMASTEFEMRKPIIKTLEKVRLIYSQQHTDAPFGLNKSANAETNLAKYAPTGMAAFYAGVDESLIEPLAQLPEKVQTAALNLIICGQEAPHAFLLGPNEIRVDKSDIHINWISKDLDDRTLRMRFHTDRLMGQMAKALPSRREPIIHAIVSQATGRISQLITDKKTLGENSIQYVAELNDSDIRAQIKRRLAILSAFGYKDIKSEGILMTLINELITSVNNEFN